ncbi:polysaccharide pyruvyl transferase family protein [Microbacterium sp. YJN-G]|uniref:polysaccharide pyruvyl transferase family protein n=1 Tax=Microbacterium sp. YJN-G TaxID=2763257 RepID=UPI00187851D5|nr:polysaccharide pyruvyl transferase family protein [Microbacterium sp. YJN-G]
MTDPVNIVIVNQHTNNYGDDAAGIALVERCFSELSAGRVDVFYIWDRGQGGLPINDDRVHHHFVPVLSGKDDQRANLFKAALWQLIQSRHAHDQLRPLVAAARAADFVLVSPAGSNIGIYKDWMYLFVLLAMVRCGVRPIFFQNTVGQSNSKIFDRVAKYVLARSELFVREQSSKEWLARQHLHSYLGVDTALLLDPVANAVTRDVIAVVPTALGNWHRDFRGADERGLWRDVVANSVAKAAVSEGLRVRVVPHLYGPQAEPEQLQQLADALAGQGCVVEIAPVASLSDYVAELAKSHIVVSMRYHGLILAALNGVPCVSLAYENKMLEAARYLDQQQLSISVKDLSVERLDSLLDLALRSRDAVAQRTADAVQAVRTVALGPLLSMQAHLRRRSGR